LSFFTCAAALANRHAQPRQQIVYYLVSDSSALKRAALDAFPDRVVVSGLDDALEDPNDGEENETEEGEVDGQRDGWMLEADKMTDQVVEMWALAETDYKIVTEHSGVGRIGE
jgi:hypothetical protein